MRDADPPHLASYLLLEYARGAAEMVYGDCSQKYYLSLGQHRTQAAIMSA